MNRDNFRANQPPSKVLHIRNLPPDATEADIMQLCKPYGRVVRLRLNAGAIKHQAFVEFENVNVAMQMIYSFVGSADPPRVRQKTVYLQYSTRQEIGNFTPGGGGGGGGGGDHSGGPVILIIMDNIHVALGPTLDTIHMLCAAFGEVAKITLFEKTGGLQALVQFHDPRHAKEAQQLLDGSSIPDHLVPQHPGKISMKVSFSAHADLTIRSQSARSRDFTNPYLPCEGAVQPPQGTGMMGAAAAAAGQAGMHQQQQQHYGGAAAGGMDHSRSNVLLVFIDDVEYTPTLDALHTVFKTYGHVHKMTVFEKSGNWQALVQYADEGTAEQAKEYLDGHCMYPNHRNKLTCQFSTHRDLLIRSNTDRSWDYLRQPEGQTAAAAAAAAAAEQRSPGAAGPGGAWQQQHHHHGDVHDSPSKAAAGGDRFPHEPFVVSGQDYERAHNEAARQAVDALGESLAGLPPRGHHPPHTMRPQQWGPPPPQGYYGQPYGGYPPYYGYPPAAGGYGGYPGYGY